MGSVGQESEPVWSYCFSAWPDEQDWRWNRATYDLFRFIGMRVQMEFTEAQFNQFRTDLRAVGLRLAEVERWPYHLPTIVF